MRTLELSLVLTMLYQSTLHQGVIPLDWKTAYMYITAILKKASRHDASNYRPISLTAYTCICKILEHIIVSEVMKHCKAYNKLSENQRGFPIPFLRISTTPYNQSMTWQKVKANQCTTLLQIFTRAIL